MLHSENAAGGCLRTAEHGADTQCSLPATHMHPVESQTNPLFHWMHGAVPECNAIVPECTPNTYLHAATCMHNNCFTLFIFFLWSWEAKVVIDIEIHWLGPAQLQRASLSDVRRDYVTQCLCICFLLLLLFCIANNSPGGFWSDIKGNVSRNVTR